jgi:hypothetical protein
MVVQTQYAGWQTPLLITGFFAPAIVAVQVCDATGAPF